MIGTLLFAALMQAALISDVSPRQIAVIGDDSPLPPKHLAITRLDLLNSYLSKVTVGPDISFPPKSPVRIAQVALIGSDTTLPPLPTSVIGDDSPKPPKRPAAGNPSMPSGTLPSIGNDVPTPPKLTDPDGPPPPPKGAKLAVGPGDDSPPVPPRLIALIDPEYQPPRPRGEIGNDAPNPPPKGAVTVGPDVPPPIKTSQPVASAKKKV